MLIDTIVFGLLLFAIYKGYKRGLIIAVFSFVAFVVGIAAAVKFSAIVAGWLGTQVSAGAQWLPMLSFAIVFIGVALAVRFGATLLEKTVQFAMLGWVNKLGGILFYGLLYGLICSALLFYAKQLQVINEATFAQSKTYPILEPYAQTLVNGIGEVIPIFKNLFNELSQFFDKIKT